MMRLVHISDLHATRASELGQSRVSAAVIDDVRALHAETPVELIVFSGDLSDAGVESEFLYGHELLIEPLLSAVGLPGDRLVVVPGNHDVTRTLINPFEEDGLRSRLTDEPMTTTVLADPEAVARVNQRLNTWRDYTETLLGHPATSVGGLATASEFTDRSGQKVGVVALNSAWRSSGATDERHLLIGEFQIATALNEIEHCDLRLVVVHHPLDWLERFDETAVRRELDRHDVIVLCGHMHEPEPSEEIRRGHAIYSRAGCLYEHATYHNSYSLVDIATDGRVTIRMRTWWHERGVFDQATDVAQDGLFTATWPSRSVGVPMPSQGDVLTRLADIAQITTFFDVAPGSAPAPVLTDLLVQPRLLPLPYRDGLAARRVEDEYEVEPVIPWNESWRHSRVVLVAGGPESGVSSALLWLLGKSYETRDDLLPVYVAFDERFSVRRLETAVEDAARQAGWSGQRKDLPDLLLGFDDVLPTGRGLDTVLNYLKEHRQHSVMFGLREANHDVVARKLRSDQVAYTSAFLGPFGRLQLRTLVEKIAGVESQDVLDTVFGVVDEQDLPRTPFTLTALVAVVITANPSDLATFTASDLLQAFVMLLLGRDDVQGTDSLGLDHRSREYLLGSYAEALAVRGVEAMPRREAEEYLASWFRVRGWPEGISPGRVLESLVARKILVEDSSKQVGFRQPALRHLFTGKWILESDEFRKCVLERPLEYPDAICHAASLQRSSNSVLSATHDATRKIVAERLGDLPVFDEVASQGGWQGLSPEVKDLERIVTEEEPEAQVPDVRERDARLDAMYEDALASEEDGAGAVLTLESGGDLAQSTFILTSVLRSSELVDDVVLKKAAFRTAIQGWGLLIAYASTAGEASALRQYLLNEDDDKTSDEELERMMRLIIGVTMLMEVQSELGTVQLARVVDELIADDELMDDSGPALFMTLLYFIAHRGGAVQEMRDLYETHDDHPIITTVVRAWAHWAYEHEEKADIRGRLEALLTDIYMRNDTSSRGQERMLRRDRIANNLRALRLKRLARRQEARGGLDELDAPRNEEGQ